MLVRREALGARRAASTPSAARSSTIARSARRMKRRARSGSASPSAPRACAPYAASATSAAWSARSAYAQLDYSPLLLAGTVLGMALLYVAAAASRYSPRARPSWRAARLGAMALSFQPMLRFYRRSPLWGLALPLIGVVYTAFTVNSAIAKLARARRHVERPRSGDRPTMTDRMNNGRRRFLGQGPSGREFSRRLVADRPRHRPAILAFYRFARAADDMADHPDAHRRRKNSRLLDDMRASLIGEADDLARRRARCARRSPSAGSRPDMRSICSKPFVATSPSCAMPTGTN